MKRRTAARASDGAATRRAAIYTRKSTSAGLEMDFNSLDAQRDGVLGFETDEVLEENKRDLVYPHRINPLTTGPGLPRFIDGSRTLNLDIVQQDRDGLTLRRWSLSRAWPVKFVAGEWDNESDENVIESVTLTYDFFELVQ